MSGRPRLAVTGGTGFIGRRFVEAARAASWPVRLLVREPSALPRGEDVGFFDLTSATAPDPAVLVGVDAVVHLAARVPPDHRDPGEAQRCMWANAHGALRLIESMAAAGVGRLVQTTSANAYAPWVERPDERAPLFPETRVPYLASKVAQELLARSACEAAGIQLTTLRLGSVYGAEQSAGAVPRIVDALLAGRTATLMDGGQFGADFVAVEDVVEAILISLDAGAAGPFNVGSGVRSTVKQIADAAILLTGGSAAQIVYAESGGPPDRGFPALDIAKLQGLGWTPRDLTRGLQELVTRRGRTTN